jgi:hypothetical protein
MRQANLQVDLTRDKLTPAQAAGWRRASTEAVSPLEHSRGSRLSQ